jgi:hypothetical protein
MSLLLRIDGLNRTDGFNRTVPDGIIHARVSPNLPAVEVGSNFQYMGITLCIAKQIMLRFDRESTIELESIRRLHPDSSQCHKINMWIPLCIGKQIRVDPAASTIESIWTLASVIKSISLHSKAEAMHLPSKMATMSRCRCQCR